MALKLRKLSYALGAEVCGVDVAKPMSEAAFGDIYHAFLENGILLFRNQDITREQHIEFSRRFGELDRHEALPRDRHPQYLELLMVTNESKPDGSPRTKCAREADKGRCPASTRETRAQRA